MFHSFRRNPSERLRKLPILGALSAKIYSCVDRNGWLSDLIADPLRLCDKLVNLARTTRLGVASDKSPLITVIVANRNNEATLENSVRSLLNQTVRNIEVIIVDDFSTDTSLDIARTLMESDYRVRVFRNSRWLGTGISRNIGMAAARGDFITFQDGDDISDRARLELQHKCFLKFPAKQLVTCNYVRVNASGEVITINEKRTMKCIVSMMFRREIILNKVGYFRNESVSEDADYFERIKIAFGQDSDILVFRTLYKALFRPESSFFSTTRITTLTRGSVQFQRDPEVADRWQELQREHAEMKSGGIPYYVPFSTMGLSAEHYPYEAKSKEH